jgi:hypothetical protein
MYKSDIILFTGEIFENEDIKLDLDSLKSQVIKFSNNMSIEKRDIRGCVNRLISAKNNLSNCIAISKALFEPEKNQYIASVQEEFKSYSAFVTYLGITNARLDLSQETIISKIEGRTIQKDYELQIRIDAFKQLLMECIYSLVIYPYKNALDKFENYESKTNIAGQIVLKDRDLFTYFLFLEFYHASEILGALARQLAFKDKLASIKLDEKMGEIPPELPSNIRYESPEEQSQQVNTEGFKDIFYGEDVS